MTDKKDKKGTRLVNIDVTVNESIAAYAKKLSSATGGAIESWMTKKETQNRAETRITEAEEKNKLEELSRRAQHRKEREEAMHQLNMENIAEKSLPFLAQNAKSEGMENDWITNFFAKARYASDEYIQQLWAKILAGEANNPGSYSKRAVNILAELDKNDVLLFEHLCSFGWNIEGRFVITILDVEDLVYTMHKISFHTLVHLESLGLVLHPSETHRHYSLANYPEYVTATYFGLSLRLKADKTNIDTVNAIKIGRVILTRAGEELARLTNPSPVEGFYDYAKKEWKKLGHIPPDETK